MASRKGVEGLRTVADCKEDGWQEVTLDGMTWKELWTRDRKDDCPEQHGVHSPWHTRAEVQPPREWPQEKQETLREEVEDTQDFDG